MRSRVFYYVLATAAVIFGTNMGGIGQYTTKPPEEDMSVKTIRVNVKKPVYHGIKLISPPHRSTLSNGVVTFQWQFDKKPKKSKLAVELVDLENSNKVVLNAKDTKRRHSMDAGNYKWRVVDAKNKSQSVWRLFKVVRFGYREAASVRTRVKEMITTKPKVRQIIPPQASMPVGSISNSDPDSEIEDAAEMRRPARILTRPNNPLKRDR